MAANASLCPDSLQRLAAMAYAVVSHALAVRATHAGMFSPFGLSLVEISSTPVRACAIQLWRPPMKGSPAANVLLVRRAPSSVGGGSFNVQTCPVGMLALMRAATLALTSDYDQLGCLLAEARAAAAGEDAEQTIRACPLFLTDVAHGTGAGLTTVNSKPVARRVGKLFEAALEACGLEKAGGLKILRAGQGYRSVAGAIILPCLPHPQNLTLPSG